MYRTKEKLMEVPRAFGRGMLKSLDSSKMGMDCITATASAKTPNGYSGIQIVYRSHVRVFHSVLKQPSM